MAGLTVDNLSLYALIQQLIKQGIAHVLVTLTDVRGSAPQDIGAKIVVTEQGIHAGTVGGGKVEALVIQKAQEMLKNEEQYRFESWNLQKDVKMTCGGEVQFFFEAFCVGVWNICIFGAGHVAQALVPLLCQLDCQVHCVDPRKEWLDRLDAKENLRLYCIENPEEAASIIPSGAFVAMMTKGHSSDVPILKQILGSGIEYPYVGMIGSKTKAYRVRKELERSGFSKEQVEQIHSPIGLPIGTNHPVEIAVSIVGEMLSVRDEK